MEARSENGSVSRTSEWFVPSFGPARFRSFVGLLFLPYTGMVLSFLAIGSALSPSVHWDRLCAIVVIYFLALGIGAHALDALGDSGPRPWGEVFGRRRLWLLAVSSVAVAYAISIYYMVRYVPLLAPLAVAEGFFVFAYNLEWFCGRFHSDGWFAFSWGFLPVLAGYVMQTNRISPAVVVTGGAMALFSTVEIKASRPYKALKRQPGGPAGGDGVTIGQYEAILKAISLGTVLLAAGMLLFRAVG